MESIEIKKRETTQDLSVLKLPDSDSQTLTNKDGTTVSSENKTKKRASVTNSFEENKYASKMCMSSSFSVSSVSQLNLKL
uniref:Uncharacterized protein n=1 Tax=Solanum tuberosum TaxID=4113 RepID=M1AFC0_SOLTU